MQGEGYRPRLRIGIIGLYLVPRREHPHRGHYVATPAVALVHDGLNEAHPLRCTAPVEVLRKAPFDGECGVVSRLGVDLRLATQLARPRGTLPSQKQVGQDVSRLASTRSRRLRTLLVAELQERCSLLRHLRLLPRHFPAETGVGIHLPKGQAHQLGIDASFPAPAAGIDALHLVGVPIQRSRRVIVGRGLQHRGSDGQQGERLLLLLLLPARDVATPPGAAFIAIPAPGSFATSRSGQTLVAGEVEARKGEESKPLHSHLEALIVDHCERPRGIAVGLRNVRVKQPDALHLTNIGLFVGLYRLHVGSLVPAARSGFRETAELKVPFAEKLMAQTMHWKIAAHSHQRQQQRDYTPWRGHHGYS
mmetsp:Transcript_42581/g.92770  ORF Transcript_42581/g.92770 Transcript_42581/m.92770 type:complete len:363 (+) Transcript_42581:768-1856(+)